MICSLLLRSVLSSTENCKILVDFRGQIDHWTSHLFLYFALQLPISLPVKTLWSVSRCLTAALLLFTLEWHFHLSPSTAGLAFVEWMYGTEHPWCYSFHGTYLLLLLLDYVFDIYIFQLKEIFTHEEGQTKSLLTAVSQEQNTQAVGAVLLIFPSATGSLTWRILKQCIVQSPLPGERSVSLRNIQDTSSAGWVSTAIVSKDVNPLYAQTKIHLNPNTQFCLSLPFFLGAIVSRIELTQHCQCKRLGCWDVADGLLQPCVTKLYIQTFSTFPKKIFGTVFRNSQSERWYCQLLQEHPSILCGGAVAHLLPFPETSSASSKQTAASSRSQLSAEHLQNPSSKAF